MNASIVLLSVLALGSAIPASATTYTLDPAHTRVGFRVTHMMVTDVIGDFGSVSGTIVVDDKDATKSTIEVTIDTPTIYTHHAKRDSHLKSEDFFWVEKYPTATFKSKKIEKSGGKKYRVTGDLTIRGMTKDAVLDMIGPLAEGKDPWGNNKVMARATGKINRKDFGLTWNKALESGGFLVGDEVDLTIDIEADPKK